MKTTFGRQFTLIIALLLVCLIITGVSFSVLLRTSLEAEKERSLSSDAMAVANLAQAYNTAGELEENWDFLLSLSFISQIGGGEALICDETGVVILCSCADFRCAHEGQAVPRDLLTAIDQGGSAFTADTLGGVYDQPKFLAGASIAGAEGQGQIGYAIVTAPMAQVTDLLGRSSQLFFYTAIAVLVLAFVVSLFLSRSQVRPLHQVTEAARRFGHGDLSSRVAPDPRSTVEIQDLAKAFNSMADSLEKSEQMRQEFIANVSHELKTPMTTIGGFVDAMLDGAIPPEKHRHYMQIVSDEVRRLSRLVRNMLDISKLRSQGVDETRKTRFDVSEAVGDVLIAFEQKINARRLQVQVDLPDRPAWTRAERDSITQVLYNLTDNAIKFCPDGGSLTFGVSLEGGKVRTYVRNTGPTIPAEDIPFLFDRFHKADKSRSADREGWGLGLYIAKTIVGAHGEDIHAESRDGVTTFSFTLPSVR